MDTNNLLQMGAQLFKGHIDSNHDGKMDLAEIGSALGDLLGGGQSGNRGSSLAGLASMLTGAQGSSNSELASLAASWLGTGANAPASASHITQMLSADKIAVFAKQLSLSPDQAVKGLQAALPEVVDKASPNGRLDMDKILDSVGGVSGVLNVANKLFGK